MNWCAVRSEKSALVSVFTFDSWPLVQPSHGPLPCWFCSEVYGELHHIAMLLTVCTHGTGFVLVANGKKQKGKSDSGIYSRGSGFGGFSPLFFRFCCCVCVCVSAGTCMPWHSAGGQRSTFGRSQLSPSSLAPPLPSLLVNVFVSDY